ncbi:MAG TPA: OstA-like protein, partial [Flavisolibacter sp.]|nr:OstA-like protein [Flavisolibacter sp.]
MSFKLIISSLFIVFSLFAGAQVTDPDSTALHILEPTQRQFTIKQKDGTELNILAGTVKLRQGATLFYCDSCVVNTKTRVFEAFGNVHINDSDTAHIYSNYLRYLIDPRYAYFTQNVRLTDGKGTLTTNQLEYDVAGKIGTYKNGGRVANNRTV